MYDINVDTLILKRELDIMNM